MKFATIINKKLSLTTTIIIDNTIYAKHLEMIMNSGFEITDSFFNFIQDIIGENKLGEKNDLIVSVIDTDESYKFFNPLDKIKKYLSEMNNYSYNDSIDSNTNND